MIRDLHAAAAAYWGERRPPWALIAETRGRRCHLCGLHVFDDEDQVVAPDGTPTPAGLHPCPPCGGWHALHSSCADLYTLVPDAARDSEDALQFAELARCPDALRVADAVMGGPDLARWAQEWAARLPKPPRGERT